ncbi:MAG: DUF4870 domain-containing protein [Paenisporosarcina sp.]
MDNNRMLSALCYFSILFAPFLLPIIIYFVTVDQEVKYHAKRSLLSHLIPVGLLVIAFVVFAIGMVSASTMSFGGSNSGFGILATGLPVLFMIVYGIVALLVLIWNIVQGVKLLQNV